MKRFVLCLILLALLGVLFLPAIAFDRDDHDKYLEKVLFIHGEVPASAQQKLDMLESASYLAVDQYNGKGKEDLDYLRTSGVSGLPKSISEIDFSANAYHRRYTHQGWNYTYSGEKDKANWPVRKEILLSTANKVCEFGIVNEIGGRYCDQCDSFCALIYYVHILGDQIHDENLKGSSEQLPFARANASESNPDLFFELKPHLEKLFEEVRETRKYTYNGMLVKYNVLEKKARTLAGTVGGINTEEDRVLLNDYENELMDLLTSYVPRLLKYTSFFGNTFYKQG